MDELVDGDAAAEGAPEPLPLAVPQHLGVDLDPPLREALHELLLDESGQLGQVYRAMVEHPGPVP
ncbi:hypothetical protein WDZ17_14680 [Pseudokineococcus basanitobsidens]|uniref:Uncharacterized protein n=1 Tax=Pseudokineococcus basanitobsidens TaxID=1926649 RepID=A0ABU8RN59_9ACTN